MLVDLASGSTHWRSCSGPLNVAYDGHTWTAAPGLAVGDIEDTGNYLATDCDIELSWSHAFVQLFPGTPPEDYVTATVYLLQGAAAARWWGGYVKGVRRQFQGQRRWATLKCVSSKSAVGAGSFCYRAGRTCQVPLYSDQCGLVQAAWEVAGVVDSFDGDEITSTTFAAQADDYWSGGPITLDGHKLMVLAHTGDTIVVSGIVADLAAGDAFTVAAGCDKKFGTCVNKANWLNYRGAPDMPVEGKNAFTQGVYS